MTPPPELGAYTLQERIARGGMGEVWRGRHARLGRDAAVKLIRASALAAGGEQRERLLKRFEREARATSALKSPHTVEVFDFGRSEGGTFFLAMELLEGTDLHTLVERAGPLPPARVAHLLGQACESLAEAHSKGLVHRDIKPANLFVCRAGLQVDFLKVLDFGLVRPDGGEDEVTLTTEGATPGSPAFMAPEVIRDPRAASPAADLYALGCVAYWLLTGRLVFVGPTPLQVLIGHLERRPEPPSARADRPVPEALDALVLRCLAKDPADRPPDARTLRRELMEAVRGEPAWTDEAAEAWWSEHRPSTWTPDPGASSDLPWEAEGREPSAIDVAFRTAPVDREELEAARKRTLDALRSHFAESRLDVGAFEARSARALEAERPAQLDALLDDLPKPRQLPVAVGRAEALPAARPEAAVPVPAPSPAALPVPSPAAGPPAPRPGATRGPRLVSVFSTTERKGAWRVPERLRSVSVFGSAHLDFRDAELGPGCTRVHVTAVFGDTTIVVPPDLYVEAHGGAVFGDFKEAASSAPVPTADGPWLRITGMAVFGSVNVKVQERGDAGGFVGRALGVLRDVGILPPKTAEPRQIAPPAPPEPPKPPKP